MSPVNLASDASQAVERYAALSAAIRRAEASGAALRVCGGRTLQPEPPAGVAALDVRQHRALLAHAREDLTVTVQAGMTVAELHALLAAAGQALPLDVPFPDRSTIGGLIATSLAGPRRFSRGGVRDLLLGITVVGRHGEVFRGGGRVVKNVAGYDLCKLFTGSWGWLGALVEATFRVVPQAENAAAAAVTFTAAAAAEACLADLLRGDLRPASLDLLNARAAARHGLRAAPFTLLIGFEGLREEVDDQLRALPAALGAVAGELQPLAADAYARYCQSAVEAILEFPNAIRVALPSAAVASFIGTLAPRSPDAPVLAHAADGHVWIGFSPGESDAVLAACRDAAAQDGSWLLPHASSPALADCPMLGPSRGDWPLMRRVKSALDPADIFGARSPFDRALRSHGA